MSVRLHRPYRVTIHCTDTDNGKSVDVEHIRQDHIARGLGDIGYHALIQPDGRVIDGRPLNYIGAHVRRANTGNLGIALAGRTLFTRAQFNALKRVLDNYRMTYSFSNWNFYCHHQFKTAVEDGKSCPNMEPQRLWCWYFLCEAAAIAPYLIENSRDYKLGA